MDTCHNSTFRLQKQVLPFKLFSITPKCIYINKCFSKTFGGPWLLTAPTWLCHCYLQQASLKKELQEVGCYLELEGNVHQGYGLGGFIIFIVLQRFNQWRFSNNVVKGEVFPPRRLYFPLSKHFFMFSFQLAFIFHIFILLFTSFRSVALCLLYNLVNHLHLTNCQFQTKSD